MGLVRVFERMAGCEKNEFVENYFVSILSHLDRMDIFAMDTRPIFPLALAVRILLSRTFAGTVA